MKMKKSYKVIITTMLMLLTLLFAGLSVQAATPKWKKVYKNFLQRNGDIYEYYFVLNIDGKGAPELIVSDDLCWSYKVYTIVGNKIKYAGRVENQGMRPRVRYNKVRKGICGFWAGAGCTESFFYTMSKNRLRTKCYLLYDNNHGKRIRYKVNYKACSAKTMKKYLNYYFKEKNIREYRCKINSWSNRKKSFG